MNTDFYERRQRRNKKLLLGILFAAFLMFFVGFLMIPLYNVMAKMDGVNGKLMTVSGKLDCGPLDISRVVTVELSTTLHANLDFTFIPKINRIELHPGQIEKAVFIATNNTGRDINVQCTPSIAPGLASNYFEAIQNFCSALQYFPKNAKRELAMQFYVNSKIPSYVKVLTLNMTLADSNRNILQRPKAL